MTGKIIKIPNEYTVIINLGEKDVSVHDKIIVFEVEDDVIDPITKELLGSFELKKAELEVSEVFPNFSVCHHYEKEDTGILKALSPMTPNIKKVPQKLNVDSHDGIYLKNPKIKVGDMVRTVELF
ncbi:hypothetical protein HMP0721_1293 [Pseudoramibacter alactolyticus ATCC 23263]|uniref:Uncharacterized protein n=1 Tax=Pseudoramibacter alactolyticus ATCC 23263 TaxID=887929 RepID=E6MH09_9FIRM|nr:hypothetical protein [Pseudoramibacter alactolyticus]EFV01899.1 hypothetical protein HMP0721_1293 [Pseudoramibacter alactolyticus ATCC 23263]